MCRNRKKRNEIPKFVEFVYIYRIFIVKFHIMYSSENHLTFFFILFDNIIIKIIILKPHKIKDFSIQFYRTFEV